jgi:CheY-like chemotaxis protein
VSIVTTVEAGAGDPAFRVLLVDNRPERRELMRHLVAGTGLAAPEVIEAGTADDASALLDRDETDVAIVEIQMPVAVGLEAIATLRSHSPGLRIVVCSFHADPATKAQAAAHGADAYLDKPVSSLSLQAVLRGFASESPPAPATASA